VNFDFLSSGQYDLWAAFWVTIQLTVWAAIGSLIWGTILAAMRVSPVPLMRGFGTVYINIFRNTPLTLILVTMSVVLSNKLGLILAGRDSTTFIKDNNFRLAVLGFIIYTVPAGQAEAARAIGLKFTQVLTLVVLPQAMRAVVAPLASVLIALTKNTTIASAIGVAEASGLMKEMIENESDQPISVFLLFALGFIALTLPVGLLLGWVANRVTVKR